MWVEMRKRVHMKPVMGADQTRRPRALLWASTIYWASTTTGTSKYHLLLLYTFVGRASAIYPLLWASTTTGTSTYHLLMLLYTCVGRESPIHPLLWSPTTLGAQKHVSNCWNRSQFLINPLLANYTCDHRKSDFCWLSSCLFQPLGPPPHSRHSPCLSGTQAVDHIDQNNTSLQTHTYPSSVNTILTRILQPFTTLYI